jgi:hypothetical protein
MNKTASCLSACLLALASTANAQKVVFTGDEFTYTWQQSAAFQSHANWIGKGLPKSGQFTGDTGLVLSAFQTNVISQHPDFVFIETGGTDIAYHSDSTPYGLEWEQTADDIIQMVQMARTAGIKVILGNIVAPGFDGDHFNLWLQAYTQADNIPLVNFQSVLEGINAEAGPNGICEPCAVESTGLITGAGGPFSFALPTEEGSRYITQMAQTAIATYGLSMTGGHLGNVQAVSGVNGVDPPFKPSVNNVVLGAGIQFTAQATWSDGVTRPIQNIPYGGVAGTWWSTNPKVMSINQGGFAYAYTPGTTSIWFKSASGHTFSPWTMTVVAPYPGPPTVPVPTY